MMKNKHEIIKDYADQWIRDDNYCLEYYKNINEFLDEHVEREDFSDEEEYADSLKEYTDFIRKDVKGDNGFYIISYIGCEFIDSKVYDEKHIYSHKDILDYFEEKELYDRKLINHNILYVNLENVDEFEKIYNMHFSNKPFSKSPYSASCYNAKNISFGNKPNGSARLSDHWNFIFENEEVEDEDGNMTYEDVMHCKSNTSKNSLAICIYDESNNEYKSVFEDSGFGETAVIKINNNGIEIFR